MTEGRCLCGALRYQIDGPFVDMLHCHCSMCRKHHGTPFATWAAAPIAGFRWLSDTIEPRDLPLLGARPPGVLPQLRLRRPDGRGELGMVIAPAGNLEGDPGIRPTKHMFVGSKAGWYEITDDLPQHEEYPPEFGSADQRHARRWKSTRRRDAGQLPVRRGRLRAAHAAAHVPVPLLALPPGRSAAHARTSSMNLDGFPLDPRRRSSSSEYKLPEAQYFTIAFCRTAAGKLPRVSRERSIAVVPAGTLDSDPGIRPQAHIFVGSKAPWFDITDELPQFAEMPRAAESHAGSSQTGRRCIAHILRGILALQFALVRAPSNPSRQPAISCPLTPTRSSRAACSRCRR